MLTEWWSLDTSISISSCWIQIATTFADIKTESDLNVSQSKPQGIQNEPENES